jgi:hypothetical protein
MYTETTIREKLLAQLAHNEVRGFFEAHPLYFFLVQAGGTQDPLSLIEDKERKAEATRLSFRVLESPEVSGIAGEERVNKLTEMAERYLLDLHTEVTKREKLLFLEKALSLARANQDKATEQKLLAEFVAISQGGPGTPTAPLPS